MDITSSQSGRLAQPLSGYVSFMEIDRTGLGQGHYFVVRK